MGWFSLRSATTTVPASPEPIVADSAELARLRELLADFERSQTTGGHDAMARAAIVAIARAGSLPGAPAWASTNDEFNVLAMRHMNEHGETGTERPWRWLAACAESAAERGDPGLVARIAFFTHFWLNALSPVITINDEMDMRLPRGVPDPMRGEIFSTALRVLPSVDPDRPVVVDRDNADNCISTGQVVRMCAVEASTGARGVTPEARAAAERVLSGRG